MKTRVYFLDNLRTFLILLVVILHAGIVYEPILENTWVVSDPVKNSSIGLIRMYLDIFVMFSLFFISGYFIPFSAKSKTVPGFLASKFKRLMVPWLVAVLTLVPAYKVIFLYSRGLPQEEWYSYFHFFARTGTDPGNFANNPVQNWLWFLPVLFLFQVIYRAMSRSGLLSLKISLKTGVALTLVAGVAYSMLISATGLRGWHHDPLLHFQRERLLPYFLVFLLGSLANARNAFGAQGKNTRNYILANVVLTLSLGIFTAVALNLFFNLVTPDRNYFFISATIDRLAYYTTLMASMLSFIYILTHVFRFNLNRTNATLSLLSRNSYSVYIIHVIVLGMIALLLLHVSMPTMLKYLLLAALTFAVSNLLVSAYRILTKNSLQRKAIITAACVSAFLSIVYFGDNNSTSAGQPLPADTPRVETAPETGLHEAIIRGDIETVRRHIRAGSDLEIKEPAGGSSPLFTAAVFGNTEAAIALIEAGADVNCTNNEGSTPLHTAAFFCRAAIVRALLSSEADAEVRNNAGSTALESVTVPFELVQGIYDYFGQTLGPLGLQLDYDRIKTARPEIAAMLSAGAQE